MEAAARILDNEKGSRVHYLWTLGIYRVYLRLTWCSSKLGLYIIPINMEALFIREYTVHGLYTNTLPWMFLVLMINFCESHCFGIDRLEKTNRYISWFTPPEENSNSDMEWLIKNLKIQERKLKLIRFNFCNCHFQGRLKNKGGNIFLERKNLLPYMTWPLIVIDNQWPHLKISYSSMLLQTFDCTIW